MVDVCVIVVVFEGQLKMYKDQFYIDGDGNVIFNVVQFDIKVLYDFINDICFVDVIQKMCYDQNGNIVFVFGKYNGQLVVDVFWKDKNYYNWILNKEFLSQVK